jgi:mRNA interferase RelE/StbE
MSYKLKFLPSALKEWNKVGSSLREQLKKKLKERLEQPEVPADRLHGFQNHYKIKFRSSGYRLVYEVEKGTVSVIVIAVGKRERSSVYIKAARRTKRPNQTGDDNSE